MSTDQATGEPQAQSTPTLPPAQPRAPRTPAHRRADAGLAIDIAKVFTALYALAGLITGIVVAATDTGSYIGDYSTSEHGLIGFGLGIIFVAIAGAVVVYSVLCYLRWRVAEGIMSTLIGGSSMVGGEMKKLIAKMICRYCARTTDGGAVCPTAGSTCFGR